MLCRLERSSAYEYVSRSREQDRASIDPAKLGAGGVLACEASTLLLFRSDLGTRRTLASVHHHRLAAAVPLAAAGVVGGADSVGLRAAR